MLLQEVKVPAAVFQKLNFGDDNVLLSCPEFENPPTEIQEHVKAFKMLSRYAFVNGSQSIFESHFCYTSSMCFNVSIFCVPAWREGL